MANSNTNAITADSFWDYSIPEPNSGCRLWLGSVSGNMGYGRFRISGGKKIHAHRFAWILSYGEIPEGLCVLHRCDIPSCVNPDHLFLGTRADNNADAKHKGRNRNQHAKKTQCIRGHLFTDVNTYLWRGGRHCRECTNFRVQRAKNYGN